MVCVRTLWRRAGPDLPGQSVDRRLPALGVRGARGRDGRRLAGIAWRGDSYEHFPRPSRRLRDGARANRGNPPAETLRSEREARLVAAEPVKSACHSSFVIRHFTPRSRIDGRRGTASRGWIARNGRGIARGEGPVAP